MKSKISILLLCVSVLLAGCKSESIEETVCVQEEVVVSKPPEFKAYTLKKTVSDFYLDLESESILLKDGVETGYFKIINMDEYAEVIEFMYPYKFLPTELVYFGCIEDNLPGKKSMFYIEESDKEVVLDKIRYQYMLSDMKILIDVLNNSYEGIRLDFKEWEYTDTREALMKSFITEDLLSLYNCTRCEEIDCTATMKNYDKLPLEGYKLEKDYSYHADTLSIEPVGYFWITQYSDKTFVISMYMEKTEYGNIPFRLETTKMSDELLSLESLRFLLREVIGWNFECYDDNSTELYEQAVTLSEKFSKDLYYLKDTE